MLRMSSWLPGGVRSRLGRVFGCLLTLAAAAPAQSLEAAIGRAAERIWPAGKAVPAGVTVTNLTALSEGVANRARAAFEREIKRRGQTTEERVQVFLTESLREYLVIAQSEGGTVIESWQPDEVKPATPSLEIRLTLIKTSAAPILDFRSGGGVAVLLSPPADVPMPRDPRGRLIGDGNLPATGSPEPFEVAPGITAAWVSGRNYLQNETAQFYSAAAIGDVMILASLDGRLRIQQRGAEGITAVDGFGSDLAAIRSKCGAGEQLLLTGRGPMNAPDELSAVELHGRALSAPLTARRLTGPVTALWPSESAGYAHMVVRNLESGAYEAFRVSIACGD